MNPKEDACDLYCQIDRKVMDEVYQETGNESLALVLGVITDVGLRATSAFVQKAFENWLKTLNQPKTQPTIQWFSPVPQRFGVQVF